MELEKYNFKGCGNCPLSGPVRGSCQNHRIYLKVKILKRILWEDWGQMRLVFNVGDIVQVEGVVKDGILYCCGGESTLYKGVKDYIDLEAIELLEEVTPCPGVVFNPPEVEENG